METVELSVGTIEYEDTGGPGPVIVFLHGLTMDGTLWRHVVADMRGDYRCILPTWPLGGHRIPMRPDADLSLSSLAVLIGEFVERLGLSDVTLAQNDWGGAQVLIANGDTSRIARMIITASEAFENYPPPPARPVAALARIPGGLFLTMQALRLRVMRRSPRAWGAMSKRAVPTEVMDAWFRPATESAAIRRDLRKYVTSVPGRDTLRTWAAAAGGFRGPVLIVWGTEDRVMPIEHGRRLAALFPDADLVELADCYTLIPEDSPRELTSAIRGFLSPA
ncbi:alpha/beta fold hydrolase [Rhodococcus maanshanensis]|uniref:Pimeloyl-ACP methyl ester carboxylesterase n=1 Tax=Rhodococcus maanshanensis TaxID=183556 RepID=A0A1H7LPG6_9NOCA|nr:alpha/beta hydrolase [Rhodococcus maanshanensis]SEL00853.1 Pimeloyl-ACP methyl ester carboxylesterase [Rhodococcus maanshanensis]